MDNGQRGELNIPSFASGRCRAMTTNLIQALESIPPTDDQALEDRALACFVVACGELGLMRNAAQRDTVVEQLTVVARKLVKSNATIATPATPATPEAVRKPVQVLAERKPAQGLAEGLMRGLHLAEAKGAARQAASRPAARPFLALDLDPPEIPGLARAEEAVHEHIAPEAERIQSGANGAAPSESVQAKTV